MKIFFAFILVIFSSCGGHHSIIKQQYAKEPDYFFTQRFGTNFFNDQETLSRMKAAKKLGIDYIRLTPSKWMSNRPNAKHGAFLLGDLEHYQGLLNRDVKQLINVLDMAETVGLKVVLTFLNIPGRIWRQHNGGQIDCRLWRDFSFHDEAQRFMQDISRSVLHHPSIVAINPLNEPEPERCHNDLDWAKDNAYASWQQRKLGTPSDLNVLYQKLYDGIRTHHKSLPIIFDSSNYADVFTIPYLTPFIDPHVLYAFHMYEPYLYTFQKKPGLSYPGLLPLTETEVLKSWHKEAMAAFFAPIKRWQQIHNLPNHRIAALEFGVDRRAHGAKEYLNDILDIFNDNGWTWAFYTFRETGYIQFDYEIAPSGIAQYWRDVEAGIEPRYDKLKSNKLIEVITSKMKRKDHQK